MNDRNASDIVEREDGSARILVVDDELGIREGCRKILASEGYTVEVAEDGLRGCEKATREEEPFDLVLVDLKMPHMDGVELLGRIREHDPEIITIVITAYATLETAIQTTRQGAYGYVPKPFTPDELLLLVRKGLEKRQLSLQTKRLREERERNLLEVCSERNKCHAIIDCLADGVLVVNRLAQFALANPAALSMLQMPRMPKVGTPLEDCIANEHLLSALRGMLSGENQRYEVITRELELNGDRTAMANMAPMRDESGAALGAVAVLRDITQLKQLERAKAAFISLVSHELKSPLGAIESLIDTVLDGTVEGAKATEMLSRAHHRAGEARRMIVDLLNISAMDAGVIRKNKERLLVKEIIEDLAAAARAQAKEKKVSIETSAVDSGAQLLADREDMNKLLSNLISNAIKYNKEGGRVTISCIAENGNVKIEVSDTGIGIPREHLPHIFGEFYRIRDEKTRHVSGTGLGLSIVKKIVDAYHGEISVCSEPGKGTTFTVTFRGGER